MIDRVLASRGRDIFSDEYNPAQAIARSHLINPEAPALSVIFRPWHGGGHMVKAFINHLSSRSAVLDYELHDQIIEPNIDRVPLSFEAIRIRIATDLSKLSDNFEYQSVHLIGMSLGNVALALVAKEYPEFSKATVVVGGDNLAALMWDGIRTQSIRRALSKQGVTKQELDEAWQGIAPGNQVEAFRGKDVRMIISTKDKVLPTAGQLNLRDKLYCAGADVSPSYSRLGHVATLTRFCIKG
ncbi:hypothetical protein KW794_00255 [Candidatus Saccharibacteria bacterium]|nr:hypothetical protein [Candidatus Saccharibacteria bacterium]